MTKTFTIEKGQKPTEAQMREAEDAKKHLIVFDVTLQKELKGEGSFSEFFPFRFVFNDFQ